MRGPPHRQRRVLPTALVHRMRRQLKEHALCILVQRLVAKRRERLKRVGQLELADAIGTPRVGREIAQREECRARRTQVVQAVRCGGERCTHHLEQRARCARRVESVTEARPVACEVAEGAGGVGARLRVGIAQIGHKKRDAGREMAV